MKKQIIFKLILFVFVNIFVVRNYGYAQPFLKTPEDIKNYLENAENCQHFAGEWDNTIPIKQQKYIKKQLNYYCSKAKDQKKQLENKYKNDHLRLQQVQQYDF